jgi:hypothetical protein
LIAKLYELIRDAATSGPALAYYFAGVNGATLQILGQSIDRLTEALPLLKEAGIRGEYFTPLGSITYWEEIYSQMKLTNRELGLGSELGRNFEQVTMAAYENVIRYGGEMTDLTDAYRAFVTEYGRNMMFSASELENMAEMRIAFGEGFEQIFVVNQMIGRSVSDTSDLLEQVYEQSDAVGVNVRSALEGIRQNLSAIDRFSFVRGSRALADMAINAERMRISVEGTLSLAEQLYDPENAIEIASQLQMLGGEFAKMADPFELMFSGRNAPEELQRRIAEATSGLAAFNAEIGEYDIDALGFSQLREFARITGMDLQELAQSARQVAKEADFRNILSFDLQSRNDFDEILSKVANFAEFRDGEWGINLGEEFRNISELTIADLDELKALQDEEGDNYKRLIESNRTLTESIQILTNSILRNLIGSEIYQRADMNLKGAVQNLDDIILDSAGFNFAESLLSEMQGETYDSISTILNGLISGNMAAVGGQIRENVTDPFGQIDQTLGNVADDISQQMSEMLEPATKFFEEGLKFFEDANEFFNNPFSNMLDLNPTRSRTQQEEEEEDGGWFSLGSMGGGSVVHPEDVGMVDHDQLGLVSVEEANEYDTRARFFRDLSQSTDRLEDVNLNINGGLSLNLEGEEISVELFKSPEKARRLLEILRPWLTDQMAEQIETRLHQLGEDARNSSNKTTTPN